VQREKKARVEKTTLIIKREKVSKAPLMGGKFGRNSYVASSAVLKRGVRCGRRGLRGGFVLGGPPSLGNGASEGGGGGS